jgi:CorA-like Mg2+ transporter protein
VDPPVRNVFFIDKRGKQRVKDTVVIRSEPFQGGYDDFLSGRSSPVEGANATPGPRRDSMFDDLIYYWTAEMPPLFDPLAPTLLSLSYYPLEMAAAEWMNFANMMHYTVENLEYATEDLPRTNSELRGLESSVHAMQSRRRCLADAIYKIRLLTNALEPLCSGSSPSEAWESIFDGFELVANRIYIYRRRFDAMIPVLTSLFQIVESRRSLAETRGITRLTHLALIFVPLTFLSSLFSMTGDLAPGKQQFWVYFAVTVPTVGVVFLVARR